MTPRIVWNADTPAEIFDAAEPLVEKWRHLLPPWCSMVYMMYSLEDQNGASAVITACPEYRWVRIALCPPFLADEDREATIVHELLEAALSPMRSFAEDLLERVIKPEAPIFHGWAENQLTNAAEGVIQDLTRSLLGR